MDDDLDVAEFFTHQHRITGSLRTGGQRLTDLLNDDLTSTMELSKVEVRRHLSPNKVVATHVSALLEKQGILFAISGAGGARAAERSFYRHVDTTEWDVLVTLPNFELTGMFHIRGTSDLKTMLLAWTGQFIPITKAKAVFTLFPEVSFSATVMIINRSYIEIICTDTKPAL